MSRARAVFPSASLVACRLEHFGAAFVLRSNLGVSEARLSLIEGTDGAASSWQKEQGLSGISDPYQYSRRRHHHLLKKKEGIAAPPYSLRRSDNDGF